MQEVPQALLKVLYDLKCVGKAESLVPLIHKCRASGSIVEGTLRLNVKEDESKALALCSQAMQHCGEHNKRF